jgi:hypothetical protein
MRNSRYCPGHPAFLRMIVGLLVVFTGTFPVSGYAQGILPALDTQAPPAASPMTPITELTGAPLTEPQNGSLMPGYSVAQQPLAPIPGYENTSEPAPESSPVPSASHEPEPQLKSATPVRPVEIQAVSTSPVAATTTPTPMVDPAVSPLAPPIAKAEKKSRKRKDEPAPQESSAPKKPLKLSLDLSQAIQGAKNMFQANEQSIKPISYSPLPGIAIFAVVKHGNERAFGDLPLLFAREYAQRLGAKAPETKIYHPIYTVDELRMQGLGHIYDQIMAYYIKTGAPEPTATDYLLKQLSTNRPTISRVIFVEADVDFNHPDASTDLFDRVKETMTDGMPKQMKYFVNSRLQIFDAEKPGFPIVWAGSWRRSVKTDQFYNVTPSVYNDSDSQQAFAKVSRQMSQEIIYITPKTVYMVPQYDTSLEGKLVSGKSQPPFPNLPETEPTPKGLTHENKQAIERILQRQNDIGPK